MIAHIAANCNGKSRSGDLNLQRRFCALFEKQRREIERLQQEKKRLEREKKQLEELLWQEREQAEKKITELEKENDKLKRQIKYLISSQSTISLSTPSSQRPIYSKPSIRKRRRKPGRKNGHRGSRRPVPVQIDKTVQHRLSKCPFCQNPVGQPCGQHVRIIEDIPEVRPMVTQHIIYEYRCRPCGRKVSATLTEALPRAAMGLRLTLLTAYLHYSLGMTTRNICA